MYGGKVKSFNINLKSLIDDSSGLSQKTKINFTQRFELNFYKIYNKKLFSELPLNQRKIINMYLSQIISINNNIFELIKYSMIRLYLIKTFKGRCFALGKPSRGQRTWSNASTANKCNRVVRYFIRQIKKNNIIEKTTESLNKKIVKKKLKKNSPKIKMTFIKKKKTYDFNVLIAYAA